MNFLAFWITATVIINSVLAEEEKPSINQVLAEDAAEGRSCYECHGGEAYHADDTSQVQVPQHTKGDLSWLWGIGGIALSVLPVLAVNIVGVVLLAILLKHIGGGDSGPAPAPIYQPAYAYSTYQAYDGGPGSGFVGSASGPTVGGGGHGASGAYKRSAEQGRDINANHSTLQFLTNVIGNALNNYSKIDSEEQ